MKLLFERIAEYLLGKKYYSVVLENPHIFNGDETRMSLSGYIFDNEKTAKTYYYNMKTTRSVQSVEIISFRSRREYKPFDNNYLKN